MSSQNLELNSNADNLIGNQDTENFSPKAIPISELAVKLPKSAKFSPDHSSQKYRNMDDHLLEDERITKSKNTPKETESKINPCEVKKSLSDENADNKAEVTEEIVEIKLKELDEIKEQLKAESTCKENTALEKSEITVEKNSSSEKVSQTCADKISIEEKPSESLEKEKDDLSSDASLHLVNLIKTNVITDVTDLSIEKSTGKEEASHDPDKEEGEIIEKTSKSEIRGKELESKTQYFKSDVSENDAPDNKLNNETLDETKESVSVKNSEKQVNA